MSRRAHLIDATARLSREEAFFGPLKDRDRLARGRIRLGPRAGESDLAAVLEYLRKVPAPLLRALADHEVDLHVVRGGVGEHYADLGHQVPGGHPPGASWRAVRTSWHAGEREIVIATAAPVRGPRALALPPGTLLLREVGRAIDALLGDTEPLSNSDAAFIAAHERDRGGLDPLMARPDAIGREEAFAHLFTSTVRGDPPLGERMPALAAAWDQLWLRLIAAEEERTHPDRLRRVAWFLRAHVLSNAALSSEGKRCLAAWAENEHGPWEREDLEKHVQGVEETGWLVRVKTPWGHVAYPLVGELDKGAIRERRRLFMDEIVANSPRLSAAARAKIEKQPPLGYGPWWPEDWRDHVVAVTEVARRLTVKTRSGDVAL
ncbi:MAG: hypothetical protein IT384_27795 [Deltaproteobacteria bacterium]|nr:hypothetical protein [Deltaproteobacteria bacterium]